MAQLSIRISDSLSERVDEFAINYGVSKSEVVRFAIEQGFFDLEVSAEVYNKANLKAIMSALFLSTDTPDLREFLDR